MNLKSTWPHVSTCTEADVLRAASGLRGRSPKDDTAASVCEVDLAEWAVCELRKRGFRCMNGR